MKNIVARMPRRLAWVACVALGALGFLTPSSAHAVPAFARQTGQPCASCHVGSFGPQLTSFGRSFKLGGYVMGEVQNLWDGFSGMIYGGFEHTNKDQPSAPAPGYSANDAWTMDQASLFYGGRLLPNLGIMTQMTYSAPGKSLSWDNTDIRFADTTTLAGSGLVFGISVNNNPTAQDVWQTTPAWAFPYLKSSIAPAPSASPFISSLGQRVVGAGVYGLWNDLVYVELSGYTNLTKAVQASMGMADPATTDYMTGVSPYWRVALQHDFGRHYVSVGTYGMDASRYPGNVRGFGKDNVMDYAFDATYQFTSNDNMHSVSLYTSYLHEIQLLDASLASGASSNAENHLNNFRANASYYYDNTYGFTVGRFSTTGTADATLYPDAPNNKPNSAGWITQLDWTPFGQSDSYSTSSYMNARFFLQYTMYNSFNGTGMNYDGTNRNASDNNTIFVGTWLAF